ncbi:MAG: acyl-CoA carboxylase subunit beta, partial [Anaerolineae bacterium]|nr:acyl-CoA carboxylase subunit beta [Anaerolineae bacterium]
MSTTLDKIKDLRDKKAALHKGGGEDRMKKQHEKGRLTARERIAALTDPDTFQEMHLWTRHRATHFGMDKKTMPAEGVVTGIGTVQGRQVCVASQDFTVSGGTVGEMHADKICQIQDMALKTGSPVVIINDSGGARIQESVGALSGYARIFYRNVLGSGVIPQIAVIAGPCAGGAAYSPALMDFIIMVKGAELFITGPQVIRQVTGEQISGEDLGGAVAQMSKSGNVHFLAENDEHALQICKQLLSYLPANNLEDPPDYGTGELDISQVPALNSVIPDDPKTPYDVKDVIKLIFDDGEFLEVQELYASNVVIGFARLNGHSVGIVANQPNFMAGVLDVNASDKIAGFVRFCNTYNIPLITLVDVPGYMPGVQQEHSGIIRHGAKVLFAYSSSTVPLITVILRKAYGGAYIAMCGKDLGADRVVSWPTGEIAVMGAAGAVPIVYRNEIKKADDPAAA